MENISFDYSKLKGRIVEKIGSQKAFAKLLGVSEPTFTSRMNGNTEFRQKEIYRSAEILGINSGDIAHYFFARRV